MGHDGGHDGATLKRQFTLWSSFAFAFAFISPIVALYGIYGLALSSAGPAFWWNFLLVFGGQMLVAMVFAELVSRWPLEGSIYQWASRLLGRRAGWLAGWAYLWTLVIAMATVALGAAGFLAQVVGINAPGNGLKLLIAFLVLAFGTAANILGRGVLRALMSASIACEVVGSIGLGTWLLLFHRHHGLGVLFQGNGAVHGMSYLTGPFLLTMAFVGFSFVGFESAGAIAEEVQSPERNLPKAIIASLSFIALVVMYTSLAITLAVPDYRPVLDGKDADPVTSTLTSQLGSGIARPLELLFVVGFFASFLALQTSASRLLWSYAREGALPASPWLRTLSRSQHLPTNAILVTFAVGGVVFLASVSEANIYTILINFSAGGFYLAFLFPLAGNVLARVRGTWRPGAYDLHGWGTVVGVLALVWATFGFFNIAWPRAAYDHWYLDWSFFLVAAVLGLLGLVLYGRSTTAAGGPSAVLAPDHEVAS